MAPETPAISDELRAFGAPVRSVVSLEGSAQPEHLPYLDLLRRGVTERPDAVVEVQGRPVLFVARAKPGIHLPRLRRTIALRSDGSFLGIIEPGRLTVFSASLRETTNEPILSVAAADAGASETIPELALAPPPSADTNEIHGLLFRLFDGATDRLTALGIQPHDALSLVGRAVFLRFLVDRQVIHAGDLPNVCPRVTRYEDCFTSPMNVSRTSEWLDETFNGDLLPLSSEVRQGRRYFTNLTADMAEQVCAVLGTVMHRAEPTGQLRLDWSSLDFAHIPIGLLSQVYERHAGVHYATAKASSVYYTPRTIAEYMVDEAFSALARAHLARVLDPAAGAGVFLVAAFRRLVAERWRVDGKRPTTATIRNILNTQLAGFEINESALRLCALSLYLTALEVDAHPRPLQRLRFDNLRGRVLFNLQGSELPPYIPGSLGPRVGDEHRGQYDLVIGNPPWTALRRDTKAAAYRAAVETSVRLVVRDRLGADRARRFSIVDDDPDVAFLWRAMEWAKPGGQIAFALHGRLLFRQSSGGRWARADLFRAVRVTGILNGSAVRQTEVWPRVSAPFCLLFAKNEAAPPDSTFYFVTVDLEHRLNDRGRIRVDAKAAQVVLNADALREPYLLKALSRGSALDVGVLRKLRSHAPERLAEYWERHGLEKGLGYQVGGRAGTQTDSTELRGLPVLDDVLAAYAVPTRGLRRFDHASLLRMRRRELYRGPLVLIPQTPDPARRDPRALLARRDVVFSRSYIGYSCAGHPEAEFLASYLFLYMNSNIPLYVALLTSGQFGVERDVYLSEDIEYQPFVPPEELTKTQRSEALTLAKALEEFQPDWEAIDAWAGAILGLSKWDRQVVADTLRTSAPWSEAREFAQAAPDERTAAAFASRLAGELRPFGERVGVRTLHVQAATADANDPWRWLTIANGDRRDTSGRQHVLQSADDLGATQLFLCRQGAIDIGILAQNRYWTQSRARLLALDLLHDEELLRSIGFA